MKRNKKLNLASNPHTPPETLAKLAGDMSTEERLKYIGASECAAVLGLSRYKTPLQVWAEKTGTIPVEDISGKLPVKLGNKLEQTVAELFTEETRKTVHRVAESFSHLDHDFIRAHIDRKIENENAILECKTASVWKACEWDGDDIPQEYILQVYHQLLCSGYDVGYIACLIGNTDFKVKTIYRDNKILADIEKKLIDFWQNYVVPKIMPTQIKAADSDVLLQLFPHAKIDKKIELSDDVNQIIESLDAMKQDKKALETTIKKDENILKAKLGDADAGESVLYRVRWSNVHKEAYVVNMPEQNYRLLKYSKKSQGEK